MAEENKCHYTNVLNRLKILDEQINQMQDTIKKVKDLMRKNLEERIADEGEGATPEQIRVTSMEVMREETKGEKE
jgi:hypothetical protein